MEQDVFQEEKTEPELAIKTYDLDPPINEVNKVEIDELGKDEYDLFDEQGNCLNEGCIFPFVPTEEEVVEFLTTGKIKGKIE